ncbi:MAG: hypothetical protein Q9169_005682 [Polycauliona sp. 2 TL-2023]
MSTEFWTVNEHIIPASSVRGFSRGAKDDGRAPLRLAVKHYIPKERQDHPNPLTIIMAHGVASSKESYEPFFDELLHTGLPIRAVWAMDIAHHGASYLLNQDLLGDEPHWSDSSRDMYKMIDYFHEQMPSPIVGISQSWGVVTISMLAAFHPRLFSAIIAMEPMVGSTYRLDTKDGGGGDGTTKQKTRLFVNRKDTWPSRDAARKHLMANPYYRLYDPRVFERVMQYDLHDIPSPSSSLSNSNSNSHPTTTPVTLTTPKTMELYTILRADPPLKNHPQAPDHITKTPADTIIPGFYRGERSAFINTLPSLLPPVLYVWGALSGYARIDYSSLIVERTGIGHGGNGGVKGGKVKEVEVEGAHHAVPLEKPAAAAEAMAPWVRGCMGVWEEEARGRGREPGFAVREFRGEWVERVERVGKL